MFSFEGDVVLDPFMGSGTTTLAAIDAARNSIGIEVDPGYISMAQKNIEKANHDLWGKVVVEFEDRLNLEQSSNQAHEEVVLKVLTVI
jgi:site-specific DNA-methyltransferase (adenine-specific)